MALNLIVPLPLGLGVTGSGGRSGLFVGLLTFWGFWQWVCTRNRAWERALVSGGAIFSLSQLFPHLQILAGAFAMNVTMVTGEKPNELQACLATILTGLELLACAAILGLLVNSVSRWAAPTSARHRKDVPALESPRTTEFPWTPEL